MKTIRLLVLSLFILVTGCNSLPSPKTIADDIDWVCVFAQPLVSTNEEVAAICGADHALVNIIGNARHGAKKAGMYRQEGSLK